MTAADTALRTLRWAATDVSAPAPEGDLAEAAALARPDGELLSLTGRLAAVTAARLRLAAPCLGDRRPPGLGAIVLAAAVGAHRQGDRAVLLLRAVRPPVSAADLLAHHGLVEAAVTWLPRLADRLLDLSPLTGVLDRPGPRTSAACEDLLDRLREDPSGRALLVRRFAAPPDSPRQSLWRGECLAYIRHEDPAFVLDVYEMAFVHHRREHEIRAREAWSYVLGSGPYDAVVPTASWWRALAELESAEPRRIRERPRLTGRSFGTNLFRRVQRMEAA